MEHKFHTIVYKRNRNNYIELFDTESIFAKHRNAARRYSVFIHIPKLSPLRANHRIVYMRLQLQGSPARY